MSEIRRDLPSMPIPLTDPHLQLVDTHCHLDAPGLAERLPDILAAARLQGVQRYVVPGVEAVHWPRVAAIADRALGIFPAFGLHPLHANSYSPLLLERLAEMLPGAVAVGEIGLDYLVDDVPRELQAEAFRRQLRMSVQAGLPVLIHCRRAFNDLLSILREERVEAVGGIMHAFSGSPETARECIRLGLLISIAGPVTFANAVRPRRIAAELPLAHLVIETDAPDLTPEPYRGLPNEPSFLPQIARTVAEIKGVTLAEVAGTTTANVTRLLRI